MALPHLEKLTIRTMYSGHLCLELTDKPGWREFPAFAEELISAIGATVAKKMEIVDMHIWRLQFLTCSVDLVYRDFPNLVSLESDTAEADEFLRELAKDLKEKNFKSAH